MSLPAHSLPALSPTTAWSIIGEPVEHIEAIGDGTRSRVFVCTLADETERVVKLLPRGTGRVEREAWVRATTARITPFCTLSEIVVPYERHGLDADVTVSRRVHAEPMHLALSHSDDSLCLSLWNAFGEGIAALHSVNTQRFGLIDGAGRGSFPSWREAMTAVSHTALDTARQTDLEDLCDSALRSLDALCPCLDEVRAPRLLHGDAQPRNVLVRGPKITAWLDLEFASGGDPLYETAFIARFFNGESPTELRRGVRWREAFAEGYTRRGALDEAPDRTRYYGIVHALRDAEFLLSLSSSTDSAERERIVTAARRALTRWLP